MTDIVSVKMRSSHRLFIMHFWLGRLQKKKKTQPLFHLTYKMWPQGRCHFLFTGGHLQVNRVKLTINASSVDKGFINLILTLLSTPLSVGTDRSLTLTNL